MASTESILTDLKAQTVFDRTFDPSQLAYDLRYNFAILRRTLDDPYERTFLGYIDPASPANALPNEQNITSIVDLADIPPKYQTVDRQSKGVGLRAGNAPNVLFGYATKPEAINAYLFTVATDKLLDYRQEQGSSVKQVKSHFERSRTKHVTGLEAVVDSVHAAYGEADAVLAKQPFHPRVRQFMRRHHNPYGMAPAYMIARSDELIFHRIGHVRT